MMLSTTAAKSSSRLQYLLIFALVLVVIVTIFKNVDHIKRKSIAPNRIKLVTDSLQSGAHCYKSPEKSDSIDYFEDILDSKVQPRINSTIFFHETSCSKTGIIDLNAKQACAIESAARYNPSHDIYVLFASPVGLNASAELPQFFRQLQRYSNIHVRNLNLWRYSDNTPISDWLKSNKLFESLFLSEHMSDVVRALTLYRYGGYHADLDMIFKKTIDSLSVDFIMDDWSTVINAALMHFSQVGIGRTVLKEFFNELIANFKGKSFIANGPKMMTKVCAKICKTKNRTLWTQKSCSGLRLQAKEWVYPISWSDYHRYFDPDDMEETLKLSKNSVAIHVWNDRSKNIWNKVGTQNAYHRIAEMNCPMVYSATDFF